MKISAISCSFCKSFRNFHSLVLLFFIAPVFLFTESSYAQTEQKHISYFSDTYQEARLKFLAAVKAAGGEVEHYRNPHIGSKNEELYTDVAKFNLSNAKTILVIGSGTHGVEGFTGSGIQTGLLREGIAKKLPDDVGLLFYHALNPYGFSHLRRFNEDNVDINRNFVDHNKPIPSNPAYDELAWLIEPDSLTTWDTIKTSITLSWYRLMRGKNWIQHAISHGQYNHPQGLFYGGNSQSWSNKTLKHIIKRHLSSASNVLLIDIHTGLGEYGEVVMITEESADDENYSLIQKLWGDKLKHTSSGDSYFPPITGSLKKAFTESLPHANVMAASMEFGTFPPREVFMALRAENHVHHNKNELDTERSKIKSELKRMFYPQKDDWLTAVWEKGNSIVEYTLANLPEFPVFTISVSDR